MIVNIRFAGGFPGVVTPGAIVAHHGNALIETDQSKTRVPGESWTMGKFGRRRSPLPVPPGETSAKGSMRGDSTASRNFEPSPACSVNNAAAMTDTGD